MASDVFTIMARKNVSPFDQENCPPEATIFVSIKKETRSNELIKTGPPCSIEQQNVI